MQISNTNSPALRVQQRLAIHAQKVDKQSPEDRVKNFEEAYLGFDAEAGRIEASRCIQCPAAPCQEACPLYTDIPAALALIEAGDVIGAAEKFRETNSLPEMCGRLCPQEMLCEGACVVGFAIRPSGENEPPVAIGRLEAFATDYQRKELGSMPALRDIAPESGYKVAVCGSGPAGLTAAEYLTQRGHKCTVFEAWSEPGGILAHGIASFKMQREIVDSHLDFLRASGIEFRCGVNVGRDVTIDGMLDGDFDAVFLATGASVAKRADMKGIDLDGVLSARDFILQATLPPDTLPEELRKSPRAPGKVVVIGADDTGIDCARTAIRLGAGRVVCAFSGTMDEMTGRLEGRQGAAEEGVEFMTLVRPTRVIGDEAGRARFIEFVKLEEPRRTGSSGHKSASRPPEALEGSEFLVEADTIAVAVGFDVDDLPSRSARGVAKDELGRINADWEGHTRRNGLFAGGDNVTGGGLVVTAVAAGIRSARAIDAFLSRKAAVA